MLTSFSALNGRSEEFSDTIQKEYCESTTVWATFVSVWAAFDSVWMAKQSEMEKLELSETSYSGGKYCVKLWKDVALTPNLPSSFSV